MSGEPKYKMLHRLPERYVGDAVYAQHDGGGIWLRTASVYPGESRVYLEPAVLARVVAEMKAAPEAWAQLRKQIDEANGSEEES